MSDHARTPDDAVKPAAPRDEIERYELRETPPYRFALERREFLQVLGGLGGGLLVVSSVPAAAAQQVGRAPQPRELPQALASWVHVDERGRVTAFTGKVEIGQNIRTSLSQTVADELKVPIAAVTLVMGDTDLTPFDRGTFGSRTTPEMAPQLARAAATAREMLIDLAAGRWQVDRATLRADNGAVHSGGDRSIAYGDLVRERPLTGVVSADVKPATADRWTVRGAAVPKINGRDFVTGRHAYTSDMVRPGMLHGRIVRPESLGATLRSLDDSRARAIEGVRVVRDGDFVGVLAPTSRAARKAAAAIRAEWQPRPQQPSSDTVFDLLKRGSAPRSDAEPPYIAGDVGRARPQAARTFEASYRIPYIAHVPLEPRAAVAEWQDGKLTVWTGTQRPFGVRAELVQAFRVPEDRVRVIVPDVGSAYGGKHSGEHAVEAARLAKAAGRPVRLVWTREEEFTWAYFRPAGVIDITAGVDADGRLVVWEFDNWNSGEAGIRTPYDVPNQRIAFHESDSPLRQGSYRALAATANHYAREMHMDAVARALGVHPVQFRLRHISDPRLRAVLTTAADKAGWGRRTTAGRALGIACGVEKGSYVAIAAELSKASGGFRVEHLLVVFECGAIVNPDGVQTQVEGVVIQGLGGALFEAIEFAGGRILNGSMERYRVPRFKDVPPLDVVLLNRRDLPSAGAGETPIVALAPAIGAAAREFGSVDPALPVKLT